MVRRPLLLLLALILAAHAVAAAPGLLGDAQEQAGGTAATAEGTAELGLLRAQREADQRTANGERTAAETDAEARGTASGARDTASEAAGELGDEAEGTVEALTNDPLGFLDTNIIRPAQNQVGDISRVITAIPEETPEEEAAPQGGKAREVGGMPVSMPMLVAAGATAAAAGTILAWLVGSSSAAGSAGGAAGAKTAGAELRRVLPYASPLFTRFEKETVMGHPKREQLYALIVDSPGVSLQRLCDASGLSRTAVTHHLRLLEHHHIVVSRRVGRSRHYYENGGRYGRDQKEAYAVLQNERSREVADFIRSNPGAIQKHLCDALGLQASIAHWHVRRLQEASLVDSVRRGRTVSYFPTSGLEVIATV